MNKKENKTLNLLFIGDIFGASGIKKVSEVIPQLKQKNKIDLIIAQCENVSGRKGLIEEDYKKLKEIGIDVLTMGNHVWAKPSIKNIINNGDIIRPLNINDGYDGVGSACFNVGNLKVRVTSLMGISFNPLHNPWKQESANNFFDAIDNVISDDDSDFHIVDFHAETTSEKKVLGLYLDGKVSALLGTHTHVQTNDAQVMKHNLVYISDVGMTGPKDSAIGANFKEVYEKMRFNYSTTFKPSINDSEFNAVLVTLNSQKRSKIKTIKIK